MGAEQGIVVSSSNLRELSSNRDLVDLRLFRAFKTWLDFKSLYNEQIGNIAGLSSLEIAQLANALSASMMRSVGFETPDSSVDLVSAKRIDQLMGTVSGTGNRVIFMRHGEQSPPEWISSISNPALRKIRMMQNPFNQEDLLTNKGLVETFTTALVLLHAQVRTGKRINVITSENKRALEVANIISQVTGCDYSIEEELNCIAYKDERDDPSVTLEALLGDLPDGNIPWNLETVDKWCRVTKNGKKPSEAIVGVIDRLCQTGIREEGNDLTIVVTHTQQLAEVLRFAGKLKDPAVRLPELSMIVVSEPDQVQILPGGVLKL